MASGFSSTPTRCITTTRPCLTSPPIPLPPVQRKRAGQKRRVGKEEERAARAAAQGGTAPLAGRKSEAADREARKVG